MRSNGIKQLRGIGAAIEKIGRDIVREYANRIYNEAVANLKGDSLKRSVRLELKNDGSLASIIVDNEIPVYVEFGTGEHARIYLAGKPQEMIDEAQKFYINGKGTMPAQPWLFPVYYKYRDQIQPEFERRVQKFLDRIK